MRKQIDNLHTRQQVYAQRLSSHPNPYPATFITRTMPAPIGNTNAQTHGARKRSVALDGSGLPKGCGKDELRTRLLRRMVEAEFSRIHNGKPPLYLLALAGTVARHEARCRLLSRYLRTEDKLTLAERMALLREITEAAEASERLLAKLIGDDAGKPASIWDALAEPATTPSSPVNATGPAAPTEGIERSPRSPADGRRKASAADYGPCPHVRPDTLAATRRRPPAAGGATVSVIKAPRPKRGRWFITAAQLEQAQAKLRAARTRKRRKAKT